MSDIEAVKADANALVGKLGEEFASAEDLIERQQKLHVRAAMLAQRLGKLITEADAITTGLEELGEGISRIASDVTEAGGTFANLSAGSDKDAADSAARGFAQLEFDLQVTSPAAVNAVKGEANDAITQLKGAYDAWLDGVAYPLSGDALGIQDASELISGVRGDVKTWAREL